MIKCNSDTFAGSTSRWHRGILAKLAVRMVAYTESRDECTGTSKQVNLESKALAMLLECKALPQQYS